MFPRHPRIEWTELLPLTVATMATVSGCGAATGISYSPGPVGCGGAGERTATVGVPIVLTRDEYGSSSSRWELTDVPDGGAPVNLDPDTGTFTAFGEGEFTVRRSFIESDGHLRHCDLRIIARNLLDCGETVRVVNVGESTQIRPEVRVADTPIEFSISSGANVVAVNSSEVGTAEVLGLREGVATIAVAQKGGLSSDSCAYEVQVLPQRLRLSCPDVIDGYLFEELVLTAEASIPTGRADVHLINAEQQNIAVLGQVSGLGSRVVSASFRTNVIGEYPVTWTVSPLVGQEVVCSSRVRVRSGKGFRVELLWFDPFTDIDLHLIHPEQRYWFNPDRVCYWQKCRDGLEWFDPLSIDDNPRLDVDDLSGFGPENIGIQRPVPGTYRIAAYVYNRNDPAGRVVPEVSAEVRVYCDSDAVEPSFKIRSPNFPIEEPFWRVADVTFNEAGECSVSRIDTFADYADARTRR